MFLNSPQTSTFDVYDHSLAIEYYSNYLQNVSPYSDFPIHQLIGRRGQAPPEVQRVAVNAMDLKIFLSRYPSIFTVTENNCVRLVKTIADCRNPKQKTESKAERPGGSDEAVEYYLKVMKKKLSSCDSTTCIPIKNLIGYRSQAPPAVQNCARNIHELVTLLSNHPETFRVFRGRLVALKQPSPVVAVRKEDQNQAPKLKYDENDSALAVEYYSNILKKSIPDYSISRLIGHRGQAPLEVQKVAYTDRDLKLFLSKFPNIFCLNGDIVTLKKSPPVLDSLKERSDIKSGGYTDDQIQNVAVKFYADVLRDRGFCGIEVPIQKLTGYGSTAPLEVQNCARNPKELYELFSKYPKVFSLTKKKGVILIEPPLDNIAPIMKNLTLNSDINSNSTKAVDYYVNIIRSKIPNSEIPIAELKCDLVQAPVDVIREARNIEELINFFSKHPKIFTVIQNQFVKLVETSTNSNTIVQKTKLKPIKSIKNLKADQKVEPIRYFPILEYPKEPAFSGSWEDHVLDNTVLVTEVDECLEACEAIKKEKIIALDCEGFNLGSGIISLIQIALVNGTVYIFDIYELPRMITLGLKEIIESDKILKVINYCRNDALNLKMQYDVNMNYIFDVSIAFHVVENKMLTLSNFKAPGFNQMCSKYGVPTNSCKDDLKFVYITQPKYWLIRPLNIKMVSYAAFDVASLVPYLYCEFLKRMDQETESAVWRLSQRMCIT